MDNIKKECEKYLKAPRRIPGKFLQLKRYQEKDKNDNPIGPKIFISSVDKFLLSYIQDLPFTPSNQRLALMVGCGQTKQSIGQHLLKLKNWGIIEDNGKYGINRKINILKLPPPPEGCITKGITIPPEVIKEFKSCSQRLVAAAEISFPEKNQIWKAWKIGMSLSSYKYNFVKCEEKLEKIKARLNREKIRLTDIKKLFNRKNLDKEIVKDLDKEIVRLTHIKNCLTLMS